MKNLINISAIVLLIMWSIGFFVFEAKAGIHLLVFLVLAGLIYDIVNKNQKDKKGN